VSKMTATITDSITHHHHSISSQELNSSKRHLMRSDFISDCRIA
jgi:hypothetical protein